MRRVVSLAAATLVVSTGVVLCSLRARYYEGFSSSRFSSHRTLAALRAISFLLSGESFSARAFPPFRPPSLPKSRAASRFSSSVMQHLPERPSMHKNGSGIELIFVQKSDQHRNSACKGISYATPV